MTTLLPNVEEAVDNCARAIRHGAPTWQIAGEAGSGKSVALSQVAERLDGRAAILLVPPEREFDAGIWALTHLSESLRATGAANGDLSIVTDPEAAWNAKVAVVRRALDHSDGVVLLCDEPKAWRPGEPHFNDRAREIAEIMLQADRVQRVVAGPPGVSFEPAGHDELAPAVTEEWLADEDEWGQLAQAAVELMAAAPHIVNLAPLTVRMLVGAAVLSSVEAVASSTSHALSRRVATRAFCRAVASDASSDDLRRVCSAIAQVRVAFDSDLLHALGFESLTALEKDVVSRVVLFPVVGGFRAHPFVRREIAHQLGRRTEVSRALTERYAEIANASDSSLTRTLHGLEAFHHAIETGDREYALQQPLYFTEQLNILGRQLSLAGDKAGAVAVFERVVGHMADDDYAHHYLAFNLDYQGFEPARVEEEYRAAIALRRSNPWWHTRYITFLIARGRLDDAWAAWNRTLDEIRPEEFPTPSFLYENLHFWVAYNLLYAGEYDLVRSVIAEVPAGFLSQNRGFNALVDRLEAMTEARDWGAFVPGSLFRPGWWRDPPHLVPQAHLGKPLAVWFAARVVALDGESVEADAAEVRVGDAGSQLTRPGTTTATLATSRFDGWSMGLPASELRVGDFLEIGFYGDDESDAENVLIGVHSRRRWRTDGLPPLTPHPQRYLRRAIAIAD